jgi:glycosyltransferase involved in cell wall biosynthesis
VGGGWWEAKLHEYAEARGAGDTVVFEGHVDEARKHEVYERAWLLADAETRERLGRGARVTSHAFTWAHAQESFATVVRAALEGRRLDAQDPAPPDPSTDP